MDDNLEESIREQIESTFSPDCVRKKSNWSVSSNLYKFDHPDFSPETLLNDIPDHSPKLQALLTKIETLDRRDTKKYGRKFKHFIFTDLKSGTYGAKLLAGALMAKGMHMGYVAPANTSGKGKKKFGKIELDTNAKLAQSRCNNFLLLSSTSVYDQPISTVLKKDMLALFNRRPENVYGELARIIILDSGYKEGIDLFDIKYIHIFEPSVVGADQKQAIGRGTRTCGQKGLDFHPTRGWPLYVFIYDIEFPHALESSFLGTQRGIELYLKAMNMDIRRFRFSNELEKTTVIGSVDYELNLPIHSFSIPDIDDIDETGDGDDDIEFIYGGMPHGVGNFEMGGAVQENLMIAGGPKRKFVIRGEKLLIHSAIPDVEPRKSFEQMRRHIREHFGEFAWTDVKMENLCAEKKVGGSSSQLIQYTPTQDFIRHYFTPANPCKGMLLFHSVGTGKCHAKDTPILMYNGSVKMVQDIKIGDTLMGDDSTPRTVLSLAQGKDELYDVIPVKGDKYTVNSEHILCLRPTRLGVTYIKTQKKLQYTAKFINKQTGKINGKSFETKEEAEHYLDEIHNNADNVLEIAIKDYLPLSKCSKTNLKGYRVGVNFQNKPVGFDPYIIGFWLGDGSKRDPVICSQDSKILHYLYHETRKQGLTLNYQSGYEYRISAATPRGKNAFLQALQKYNLINNKHIPDDYKINDRSTRLLILAGLIDSDGYKDGSGYEISQKNKTLAHDILFLCRSLGFAAYLKESEKSCMYKGEKKTGVYCRITISGDGLDDIPVKIDRKRVPPRAQKKDVLVTGIDVKSVGMGDYFGFTLDGNNRYILGDFTVTHNTCSAIAAATSSFEKEGYTILWVTRTTLKNDIWKNIFDQICNESIRGAIENQGLVVPADQKKRMRLLSKSWRIRPMSYKQFSNLVSKQNAFYKSLVKQNGELDPLRKTLLIIDEAHKLYGGGDLSSIERPDMAALHAALMNSYAVSGRDSARLLLMTATPITQDPMELIQLINLAKPAGEQLPAAFDQFADAYLTESGEFTERGRATYLDDIAGYVSYLNREKDARQFSQPIIEHVHVPIANGVENAKRFDKRIVREFLETEAADLQGQIIENQKKLEGELGDVDASKFLFLKDEFCGDLEGKSQKQCERVVKANIKQLVAEAKTEVKSIRLGIQEIRAAIKARNATRKDALDAVKKNIEEYQADYDTYKGTALYQLRNKCATRIKTPSELYHKMQAEDPDLAQYNQDIDTYNQKINELHDQLKTDLVAYKVRMDKLKKILKQDLSEIERNVIKMTVVEEQQTRKRLAKLKKKTIREAEKQIRGDIKQTETKKRRRFQKLRSTAKKLVAQDKRDKKKAVREERKLKRTLRKQGELQEEIQHEGIKTLVDTYSKKIENELAGNQVAQQEKEREKEEAKLVKVAAKAEAKAAKVAAKAEEKVAKADAKEQLRQTKKLEKERVKAAAKATRKNNKA